MVFQLNRIVGKEDEMSRFNCFKRVNRKWSENKKRVGPSVQGKKIKFSTFGTS